jgi:hypothetical protein
VAVSGEQEVQGFDTVACCNYFVGIALHAQTPCEQLSIEGLVVYEQDKRIVHIPSPPTEQMSYDP